MVSQRSRLAIAGAAVLVVVLGAFAAYWFQPWRLFTHSHIDESLPSAVITADIPASGASASVDADATALAPSTTAPPPITELSSGEFVDGEHHTGGTARVLRLADGKIVVRLENFSTSDGPDLYVILSSAEAGSGSVGDYVNLGKLKATGGNQNYAVKPGTDLSGYNSVMIWCKRFNAVFGSAAVDVST